MKLRIPRRIKVEEDSSEESESENVPAESTSAQEPASDKNEKELPAASSKTILVSGP